MKKLGKISAAQQINTKIFDPSKFVQTHSKAGGPGHGNTNEKVGASKLSNAEPFVVETGIKNDAPEIIALSDFIPIYESVDNLSEEGTSLKIKKDALLVSAISAIQNSSITNSTTEDNRKAIKQYCDSFGTDLSDFLSQIESVKNSMILNLNKSADQLPHALKYNAIEILRENDENIISKWKSTKLWIQMCLNFKQFLLYPTREFIPPNTASDPSSDKYNLYTNPTSIVEPNKFKPVEGTFLTDPSSSQQGNIFKTSRKFLNGLNLTPSGLDPLMDMTYESPYLPSGFADYSRSLSKKLADGGDEAAAKSALQNIGYASSVIEVASLFYDNFQSKDILKNQLFSFYTPKESDIQNPGNIAAMASLICKEFYFSDFSSIPNFESNYGYKDFNKNDKIYQIFDYLIGKSPVDVATIQQQPDNKSLIGLCQFQGTSAQTDVSLLSLPVVLTFEDNYLFNVDNNNNNSIITPGTVYLIDSSIQVDADGKFKTDILSSYIEKLKIASESWNFISESIFPDSSAISIVNDAGLGGKITVPSSSPSGPLGYFSNPSHLVDHIRINLLKKLPWNKSGYVEVSANRDASHLLIEKAIFEQQKLKTSYLMSYLFLQQFVRLWKKTNGSFSTIAAVSANFTNILDSIASDVVWQIRRINSKLGEAGVGSWSIGNTSELLFQNYDDINHDNNLDNVINNITDENGSPAPGAGANNPDPASYLRFETLVQALTYNDNNFAELINGTTNNLAALQAEPPIKIDVLDSIGDIMYDAYLNISKYEAEAEGNTFTSFSGMSVIRYLASIFQLCYSLVYSYHGIHKSGGDYKKETIKLETHLLHAPLPFTEFSSAQPGAFLDPRTNSVFGINKLVKKQESGYFIVGNSPGTIDDLKKPHLNIYTSLIVCAAHNAELSERTRFFVDYLSGLYNVFFSLKSTLNSGNIQQKLKELISAIGLNNVNYLMSEEQLILLNHRLKEFSTRAAPDYASPVVSLPQFKNFKIDQISLGLPIEDLSVVSWDLLLNNYFSQSYYFKPGSFNRKIMSVGIPRGLHRQIKTKMSSNKPDARQDGIINLKVWRIDSLNPMLIYRPLTFKYSMNVFPTRILNNLVIDKANDLISGIPVQKINSLTSFYDSRYPDLKTSKDFSDQNLYKFHVLSLMLEEYLNFMTDLYFDEHRYFNYSNITQNAQNILSNTFLASLDKIKSYLLTPRKFDRVFHLTFDPDDFIVDTDNTISQNKLLDAEQQWGFSVDDILKPYVDKKILEIRNGLYRRVATAPSQVTYDSYYVTIHGSDE